VVWESETPVSRETERRLRLYLELLVRWNERINLVAPGGAEHLWHRHFEDALQLIDLLPNGGTRAVDLGSGGGFPGLVLAIATRLHVDLLEADQRKAAFLREVIRQTRASAAVHAVRIETAVLAKAPIVTARALGPLPRLLPMVTRFLELDGIALLPKGRNVDIELTDARRTWNMTVERFASRTDRSGVILRMSGISPIV